MAGSLLPLAKQIALDNSANPGNGWKFYTYEAGTLTPKTTYQDAALTDANPNPTLANARGEVTMYGSGMYRIILKDSSDNTIWDRDNVEVGVGAVLVTIDSISLDAFVKSRVNRVVSSISALKALDKTKYTQACVTGYYAAGDGGGGIYYYDSADTTSVDNGGTVIVAADGGRWKLTQPSPVNVKQFDTPANAVASITSAGSILVTNGGTTTPISAAGKNILWEYDQGGNADNVIDVNGNRGGLFADYDCKAGRVLVQQIREDQSAIAGGGFRDLLFLNVVDNDTVNYTTIGQKVTNGIRSFVTGAHNGTSYQAQYKDLVGSYFAAVGNIQWAARGVSAITADAYQFGIGIASNEFVVHNPSAADGAAGQSTSMAAVQAIVRARYADEDGTHLARGVYVENNGRRITAGIEMLSNTGEGFTSHYKFGLKLDAATVTDAAIVMPQSATGNVGTVIQYDTNDYSAYDRTNNQFTFVVGSAVRLATNANGITIGSATNSTKTRLYIEPSTTGVSHMQLYPGATPSSPNNGELWFDGAAVKIVVGGVVKTFSLT